MTEGVATHIRRKRRVVSLPSKYLQSSFYLCVSLPVCPFYNKKVHVTRHELVFTPVICTYTSNQKQKETCLLMCLPLNNPVSLSTHINIHNYRYWSVSQCCHPNECVASPNCFTHRIFDFKILRKLGHSRYIKAVVF